MADMSEKEYRRTADAFRAMGEEIYTPRLTDVTCPTCGADPTHEVVQVVMYVEGQTIRTSYGWVCPACYARNEILSVAPREDSDFVEQVGAAEYLAREHQEHVMRRHYAVRPEDVDLDPMDAESGEVMDAIERLMEEDDG